jgi:diguanylate cyclase (GGDEF)-like protein
MKRRISGVAILLGCVSAAWATAPATLTTLRAIHDLTSAQADQAPPVAFEATVTYYNKGYIDLFVQDEGAAIYVETKPGAKLAAGDRVFVQGHARDSFRTDVVANSVTVLYHGSMPKPVAANFDQMIHVERDCLLVTVRAVVHSADVVPDKDAHVVAMKLLMDGGYIDAEVVGDDPNTVRNLLDAEVEVTGVVSGRFDGKMQLTGILIEIPTLAGIKILKPARAVPKSLPFTPLDQVLSRYHVLDLTQRVRVRGTITYYHPGSAVVLQSGASSLWIMTGTYNPLHIGNLAEATGFPDVRNGFLTLTEAEIEDTLIPAPIAPRPVTRSEMESGITAFDTVSTDGRLVMAIREGAQDEYVILSDGQLVSAIYRHPVATDLTPVPLPPMKEIALGSKVRVTGVCAPYSADPFHGPVAFDMLLRSFDDITVIANPSLLNIRNLILAIGLLLVMVLAAGARSWTLERRVRLQATAMAARTEAEATLERHRSRILEDINGSRPLAEIIEEITELISFKLDGALCWCEIAGGACLGNRAPGTERLRVIEEEIPSHSERPLGTIFAALDLHLEPSEESAEALSIGAGLAALAIETRHLYSDLVRRSEFDLLTDTHNRFSLDSHLEARIDQARLKAGIFGLIYIDLDKFKQVNDFYGHHVGDLYLQEVSQRMKNQLRSHDILARLGGDEFAVLVPSVRSRAEVDEIVLRLKHSFDAPFTVEGQVLHGRASIGAALYPEDGATKDSLLSAADAAMYAVKHAQQEAESIRLMEASAERSLSAS